MTTKTLPLSGPELAEQQAALEGLIATREAALGECIVDGALAAAKSDTRGEKDARVAAAKVESELAPLRARRQALRGMEKQMLVAWKRTIEARRTEDFEAALLLVDGARANMLAADAGLRQAISNLLDVVAVWMRVRGETDHLWARLNSAGNSLKRPVPSQPPRSFADLKMWRHVMVKDVLTALRGIPGKSSPLARLGSILSSRGKD